MSQPDPSPSPTEATTASASTFEEYCRAMDQPCALFRVRGARGEHDVEVRRVERTMGTVGDCERACPSSIVLVLRDAAGVELARGDLEQEYTRFTGRMEIGEDGPLPPKRWIEFNGGFHGAVPDLPGGVELAILEGETVLWSRRAPERMPVVRDLRAAVEGDSLRVTWTDEVATAESECEVRWRHEGRGREGMLGHAVRGEATADLWDVPAGRLDVRVRVHDGFNSVDSEPVAVEIPPRPMRVEIIPPLLGVEPPAGAPMLVGGMAHRWRGELVTGDDAFRWTIDGTEVARGSRTWIDAPAEGEHELALAVTAEGEEQVARLALRCRPAEADPRWRVFADVFRDGKPFPKARKRRKP